MTSNKNKLPDHYLALLDCITQDDFSVLYSNISLLPDEDLLQFIKRTGVSQNEGEFKYKSRSLRDINSMYFWHSKIVIERSKLLFSESNAERFLFDYFSSPKNATIELNRLIVNTNPEAFFKIIKLTQAFLHNEWFSSIPFLKISSISKQQIIYKELEYFKTVNDSWLKEKIGFLNHLVEFSIDNILIQTIAYFEKYKRSSREVVNHKSILTSKEVTLCYVLNNILNDYRNYYKTEHKTIANQYTIDQFYNKLHEELSPINPPEGIAKNIYIPVETISRDKKTLREIIEYYFSYYAFGITMDKYCVDLLNFDMIDEGLAELSGNEKNRLFHRNDKKNRYVDFYYLNRQNTDFQIENTEKPDELERLLNVKSNLLLMEELCIKPKSVSLEKALDLLWNFSTWLMPQGRFINTVPTEEAEEGIYYQPIIYKKSISKEFAQLFRTDYLVKISEDELINSCVKYFDWTETEVKQIIEFLTYDLNDSQKYSGDFLTRPLIKIENTFYWLSSLLRDRSWPNIMFKRLVLDHKNDHIEQTKELEKKLATLFEGADFKAIPSRKYNDGEGEIDCLAHKDGVLILIELKTTYLSEDLLRQSEFDNKKLEHKAAEQLDRAISYIQDKYDTFIKLYPELNIPNKIEDIQIVSLIVSNTFDWDNTVKSNRHLKISLLELEVILTNSLFNLLNIDASKFLKDTKEKFTVPINFFDSLMNKHDPYFKNESFDSSKESCDLWNAQQLSANKFIELIKSNKVWDFLDKLWTFKRDASLTIGPFNPDEKWLS